MTNSNHKANAAEITANIERIFPAKEPVELRCISSRGCQSGIFDDYAALGRVAATMNGHGADCFFGLNPPAPKTVSVNNTTLRGSAISETQIKRRRNLLIDIDPVRDPKTSSTDDEKREALKVVVAVLKHLESVEGCSKPLLVDSGNGFHIILPVDLVRSDDQLVDNLLRCMSRKFGTDRVKIDTSVGDPARVSRLPGTINLKGENLETRPHRISRLIGNNEVGQPMGRDALTGLIDGLSEPIAQSSSDAPAEPVCLKRVAACREWLETQSLIAEHSSGNSQLCAITCKMFQEFGVDKAEASLLIDEYAARHFREGIQSWNTEERDRIIDWATKQPTTSPKSDGQAGTAIETEGKKEKLKDSEVLINIAKGNHDLWYTPDNEKLATIHLDNGAGMNLRIKSDEYRERLASDFYYVKGKAPSKYHMDDAIDTLCGIARFEGEKHKTHIRVAGHEGNIYIDLGNEEWSVVEVSADGWRIIQSPPVRFRRSAGLAALPVPAPDGSIGPLRDFVNVSNHDEFMFIVAYMLMTFHPDGEYPILILYGQQGSSKSTIAKVIRRICDPNVAPLRSNPRGEDDFCVMAMNNRLVVLDNLSFIPDWFSDALCRMATGGTSAKRKNYSDNEEVLISYSNPGIINGVVDVARRPDLLDRGLLIDLPVIENRISSSEFWTAFEDVASTVFGGLLNALVHALRNPCSNRDDLPRMAEFAKFVMAAEPELRRQWNCYAPSTEHADESWAEGDFLAAYEQNIDKASAQAAEQVPWIPYLELLVDRQGGQLEMSASQLLNALKNAADAANESTYRGTGWPQSAPAMGNALQRHIPVLNERGLTVERKRQNGGNRERIWHILRDAELQTSGPVAETPDSDDGSGFDPGIYRFRTPEERARNASEAMSAIESANPD